MENEFLVKYFISVLPWTRKRNTASQKRSPGEECRRRNVVADFEVQLDLLIFKQVHLLQIVDLLERVVIVAGAQLYDCFSFWMKSIIKMNLEETTCFIYWKRLF